MVELKHTNEDVFGVGKRVCFSQCLDRHGLKPSNTTGNETGEIIWSLWELLVPEEQAWPDQSLGQRSELKSRVVTVTVWCGEFCLTWGTAAAVALSKELVRPTWLGPNQTEQHLCPMSSHFRSLPPPMLNKYEGNEWVSQSISSCLKDRLLQKWGKQEGKGKLSYTKDCSENFSLNSYNSLNSTREILTTLEASSGLE